MTHNPTPTDAQMKLAREALAQAATELAPPSSSMRMNDFTDKAAQISARAIVLAIQATEARAQGLVEALEPFEKALGKRQLRYKEDESVTWSAITVGDLRKARQALATWRRT